MLIFVLRRRGTSAKGVYDTEEQKGTDMADHADSAIKYGQTGQPEVQANGQEFYIWEWELLGLLLLCPTLLPIRNSSLSSPFKVADCLYGLIFCIRQNIYCRLLEIVWLLLSLIQPGLIVFLQVWSVFSYSCTKRFMTFKSLFYVDISRYINELCLTFLVLYVWF